MTNNDIETFVKLKYKIAKNKTEICQDDIFLKYPYKVRQNLFTRWFNHHSTKITTYNDQCEAYLSWLFDELCMYEESLYDK